MNDKVQFIAYVMNSSPSLQWRLIELACYLRWYTPDKMDNNIIIAYFRQNAMAYSTTVFNIAETSSQNEQAILTLAISSTTHQVWMSTSGFPQQRHKKWCHIKCASEYSTCNVSLIKRKTNLSGKLVVIIIDFMSLWFKHQTYHNLSFRCTPDQSKLKSIS